MSLGQQEQSQQTLAGLFSAIPEMHGVLIASSDGLTSTNSH